MASKKPKVSIEQIEKNIYSHLQAMLARTDVASKSYKPSSVAMHCDEKLLEEFLSETPFPEKSSLKQFLQGQLYTAAFWGFYDIIEILLQYGADINYKNPGMLWTPLHAACFQENEKVVELLIQNGANVRSKDRNGRTCIDIASVSNKIWPQFQKAKCERTLENDLLRKGLLKHTPNMTDTPPRSSRLSNGSSSQMRAALGGAGEDGFMNLNSMKASLTRSGS